MIQANEKHVVYHGDSGSVPFLGQYATYSGHLSGHGGSGRSGGGGGLARSHSARGNATTHPVQLQQQDYSLGYPYAGSSRPVQRGQYVTKIQTGEGGSNAGGNSHSSHGVAGNSARIQVTGTGVGQARHNSFSNGYSSLPTQNSARIQVHNNQHDGRRSTQQRSSDLGRRDSSSNCYGSGRAGGGGGGGMVNGAVNGGGGGVPHHLTGEYQQDAYQEEDSEFIHALGEANDLWDHHNQDEYYDHAREKHVPMYGKNGVMNKRRSYNANSIPRKGRYDKKAQKFNKNGEKIMNGHVRDIQTTNPGKENVYEESYVQRTSAEPRQQRPSRQQDERVRRSHSSSRVLESSHRQRTPSYRGEAYDDVDYDVNYADFPDVDYDDAIVTPIQHQSHDYRPLRDHQKINRYEYKTTSYPQSSSAGGVRRSKSETRVQQDRNYEPRSYHNVASSRRVSSQQRVGRSPRRRTTSDHVSRAARDDRAFEAVDYEMARKHGSLKRTTDRQVPFDGDPKFLRKVQHELEGQRHKWKGEVDKITENVFIESAAASADGGSRVNSPVSSTSMNTNQFGNNAYVDTSSGTPIFKAFVDIRAYPPESVTVNVDKLENKIVVKARKPSVPGQPDRTFTQKVQLPRFSDDKHIKSGLNAEGFLVLRVPLIYFFPHEQKSPRAFINEVKTRPDGSRVLEILVNVGYDYKQGELKCQLVNDAELVITGCMEDSPERRLIKRYTLPKNADKTNISSTYADDGRLVVIVPLLYGSGLLGNN